MPGSREAEGLPTKGPAGNGAPGAEQIVGMLAALRSRPTYYSVRDL